jgi:hypothetical protein
MTHENDLMQRLSSIGVNPHPDPDLPPWTEPPAMGEDLAARMKSLGLEDTRQDLENNGFAVIRNAFSPEECDQLMAAVRACSKLGAAKNILFKGNPLLFSALANKKMMTLAASFLGPDFLLMQYSSTVLGPGGTGFLPAGVKCFGLHSDQPATDPGKSNQTLYTAPRNRNNLLTCCVILSDGYTADTGATYVVPGSHRLRRFPDVQAITHAEKIAEPILGNRGDIACWDGNVWHAFGVRQIPGERIVMHISFAHPEGSEAEDDYDCIPAESFMGTPYQKELVQLLQRHPETGEILTAHPRRRRLYWEEASLRLMEWFPKAVGLWLYKKYFDSIVKKELTRVQRAQSENTPPKA